MKTSEVLIAARALIATPDKWTKCATGRDSKGHSVGYSHESAVCFCALGAVAKVAVTEPTFSPLRGAQDKSYMACINVLGEAMKGSVGQFNDHHSHSEVLFKFDEAISASIQQELENGKE